MAPIDLQKILQSKKAKSQSSTSRQNILDDLPFLFRDVCGLKLDGRPAKTGLKREPKAWADLRPDWPWMLAWNFLCRKPRKGKYGKLLLLPRGCAKSTMLRVNNVGTIILDHDYCTHYLSQNVEMAAMRVSWVRQRLKANEKRFGEFETRDNWGNESFTVVRTGAGDEPTMKAGGPDKDVTGSHPDRSDWDDPVVPKTNSSRNARRKVIKCFEDALAQYAENTEVRIVGTVYRGHNLYREIRDHYQEDFEILRIGAWGAAYNEKEKVIWGDPKGEALNFPWFTMDYLNRQRRTPALEIKFRGQYLNLWQMDDEGASFEPSFLLEGEPPMTKDGKLDPRLAVYMLTDLGQTDRTTKGTSETALIVVAKDIDGILYIVDIELGRFNSDEVQERFLRMYHRWEDQGLRYATMETRGPGRDALYHIPKLAEARGEKVPAIIPIPRSSMEDKASRIGYTYAPFKAHQIKFATKLISKPHLFRIDSRGTPMGIVAERILDYSPLADSPDDFLDALADAYIVVKDGFACPDPSPPRPEKKPLNDYEWALQRALGKLRPKYNIL